MLKKLAAEFVGTAWLVLGGCGSAVLAAGFPQLGIGFVGVALAFGLTVLTMAYAVGHADQAKAEWTAVDQALRIGPVSASPVRGLEPVHAVSALSPHTVSLLALKPAEVRSLGWRWPRRWTTLEPKETDRA